MCSRRPPSTGPSSWRRRCCGTAGPLRATRTWPTASQDMAAKTTPLDRRHRWRRRQQEEEGEEEQEEQEEQEKKQLGRYPRCRFPSTALISTAIRAWSCFCPIVSFVVMSATSIPTVFDAAAAAAVAAAAIAAPPASACPLAGHLAGSFGSAPAATRGAATARPSRRCLSSKKSGPPSDVSFACLLRPRGWRAAAAAAAAAATTTTTTPSAIRLRRSRNAKKIKQQHHQQKQLLARLLQRISACRAHRAPRASRQQAARL